MTEPDLSPEQYRDLSEFRRQIRQFLYFSEATAKEHQIEPQQHQLLLAIKGLPEGVRPTIGELAERMLLRHSSAVGLVDRLAEHGAIERVPSEDDHRAVLVRLTKMGEMLLHNLSVAHHEELRRHGPELMKTLRKVLGAA